MKPKLVQCKCKQNTGAKDSIEFETIGTDSTERKKLKLKQLMNQKNLLVSSLWASRKYLNQANFNVVKSTERFCKCICCTFFSSMTVEEEEQSWEEVQNEMAEYYSFDWDAASTLGDFLGPETEGVVVKKND